MYTVSVISKDFTPLIILSECKLLPLVHNVQIAMEQLSQYPADHVMDMKADNWCFVLC